MDKNFLESYLNTHIPLSQHLGIKVRKAGSDKVILYVPLEPNINHKQTAFGGSIHAAATLACWSVMFINLKKHDSSIEIVISRSEIEYLVPLKDDFIVESIAPDKEEWLLFEERLNKKGKARIQLNATIKQEHNMLAVNYLGDFVAIKK